MNKMDVAMLNAAIEAGQSIRMANGKKVSKVVFLSPEEGAEVEYIQRVGTFVDDTDIALVEPSNPMWAGWMTKIGRSTAIAIRMPETTQVVSELPWSGMTPDTARGIQEVLQTVLEDEEVRKAVKVLLMALAGMAGRHLDKAVEPQGGKGKGKKEEMTTEEKAVTAKSLERLAAMLQQR